MANHIRIFSLMVIAFAVFNSSSGYAISPMVEPADDCIYACVHCFKDHIGVICANECLATEGKMHPFWHKTCPELAVPHFFLKALEEDENFLDSQAVHDNKLH